MIASQIPSTNRATSTSGPQALPAMGDLYQNQLANSQSTYKNVLGLYTQGQQNLESKLPSIYDNYDALARNVGGQLQAAYKPAITDIRANLSQRAGELGSQMTSRGLGNTTIGLNAGNQLQDIANRSIERVAGDIGNRMAGYGAQIGSSKLAAQMQGLGMQSGMAQGFGGILGGFHFPSIPNLYGQYSNSFGPAPQAQFGGGGISGSPTGGAAGGGIAGLQHTLGGMGAGLGMGGGGAYGGIGYGGPAYAGNPYYGAFGQNPYGAFGAGGSQQLYPGVNQDLNEQGLDSSNADLLD